MNRPFHLLASLLAVALIACGSTTQEVPDLNLVNLQCRAPSACYRTDCECARLTFQTCMLCDPNNADGNVCECLPLGENVMCLDEVNVCVARGVPCRGRCVALTGSCATSVGFPPQTVSTSTDAGTNFETRCPFTDDICCEGEAPDLSTP